MKRREFMSRVGRASVAAAGTGLAAPAIGSTKHRWKMVTAWPKNFPGLGTGAEFLAALIGELSDGALTVKVYGAGELVPAFEVFDAVSRGTAEMGHGAAYYWKGKHPATQFFAALPFGLTAQEMNAWLYHGGGMELWRDVYASFGLIPLAAGNTGVQMAGWFNREIGSVEDLKGLKMRIPGLGGEVLRRAGGTPVNLPGSEIFTALQSGAIDATEWVGPYNDLAFGLHRAAKYYYYPGWQEPGSVLEAMVNKSAFDALPKPLQSIVSNACRVANGDLLADLTAKNTAALGRLVDELKVDLRKLPDDVLKTLHGIADETVRAVAAEDPLAGKVHESMTAFRANVARWSDVSERAYLNARAL